MRDVNWHFASVALGPNIIEFPWAEVRFYVPPDSINKYEDATNINSMVL